MHPYQKLNWYPHMMPADVAIWERFIEKYPEEYESVEYDVKVGTVPDFVKEHPETAMQDEAALYQRKIDVVGHNGPILDIIELKPNAGMSTIGQVKGYVALYKRDIGGTKTPKGKIITDRIDPDVLEVAKMEGVEIVVV